MVKRRKNGTTSSVKNVQVAVLGKDGVGKSGKPIEFSTCEQFTLGSRVAHQKQSRTLHKITDSGSFYFKTARTSRTELKYT